MRNKIQNKILRKNLKKTNKLVWKKRLKKVDLNEQKSV